MCKQMTLPLFLTWSRIFLVPVFVIIYYLPNSFLDMELKNLIATVIFVFAAITDYLDGYFARLLKQETSFGAFLDPVADKALVVASLVILVNFHRTFWLAAIIIIVREISISALREWMAQIGKVKSVAVAYIGKLKTAMQMLAIGLLLIDYKGKYIDTNKIGNFFMLIAVIITIVSMVYYLEQAKKNFKNSL
jgi:cardiolipin synthase